MTRACKGTMCYYILLLLDCNGHIMRWIVESHTHDTSNEVRLAEWPHCLNMSLAGTNFPRAWAISPDMQTSCIGFASPNSAWNSTRSMKVHKCVTDIPITRPDISPIPKPGLFTRHVLSHAAITRTTPSQLVVRLVQLGHEDVEFAECARKFALTRWFLTESWPDVHQYLVAHLALVVPESSVTSYHDQCSTMLSRLFGWITNKTTECMRRNETSDDGTIWYSRLKKARHKEETVEVPLPKV